MHPYIIPLVISSVFFLLHQPWEPEKRRVTDPYHVQGTGKIFRIDPLTSSGHRYGDSGYTDRGDSNSAELNNQLISVVLDSITFDPVTGMFSLKGPWCEITDHTDSIYSAPHLPGDTTSFRQDSSDFSSDRSDPRFEAVMAYYYITENQQHIQSLGFHNILNYPIKVDVHALREVEGFENNAMWKVAGEILLFGCSPTHVDNAEDAGSILHEYAHAIHGFPLEGKTISIRSVEEGFADYWAGSFILSLDPTLDSLHYWGGRNSTDSFQRRMRGDTITYRAYDDSLGKDEELDYLIYRNAFIWTNTLMDIRGLLGRATMDKLVLTSIADKPSSILANAESLLTAVDKTLVGQPQRDSIYNAICGVFLARHYPIQSRCAQFAEVNVRNMFQRDSTNYAELERWSIDGNCDFSLASGQSFFFKNTDTVQINTERPMYYGADPARPGNRNQFHNWDGPVDEDSRHLFQIAVRTNIDRSFESYLNRLFPAQMKISLETRSDSGVLRFLNPWFITGPCPYTQDQEFRTHQITADTSSEGNLGRYEYGGVFLDQNPDTSNSSVPYYSLRASKYIDTTGAHKWPGLSLTAGDIVFGGWDTSKVVLLPDSLHQDQEYDTKAVIFKDTGAVVTARYKAHLLSDVSFSDSLSESATSPNSQRKIDFVPSRNDSSYPSGLYEAVYESAGDIWLVSNKSGTDSCWLPEILVSSGVGTAHQPCIASDTSGMYVVYREGGGIEIARLTNRGWTRWSPLNGDGAAGDACPVLEADGATRTMFAVWERGIGGLGYAIYTGDTLYASGVVPGAGSTATRPTMAHPPGSTAYYLAWREGTRIYYKQVTIETVKPYVTFFSSEQANTTPNGTDDAADQSAPSITVTNYTYGGYQALAAIAWEAQTPPDQRHIALRLKTFYGWSSVEEFWPDKPDSSSYWAPSVMSLDTQPCYPWIDAVRVAANWDWGANPIPVFVLECGFWSVLTQGTYETLHPSTVAYPPIGHAKAIFPSRIVPTRFANRFTSLRTNSDQLNKKMNLERSRELVLVKDTTVASLHLGELKIEKTGQSTKLEWSRGFDTLIVGFNTTIEQEFRTSPFTIEQGTHLKGKIKDMKKGLQSISDSLYLRVQIMRESTNQPLLQLQEYHPRTMGQGRRVVTIAQNLNAFAGETVYLRLTRAGNDSAVAYTVRDHYTPPGTPMPKVHNEQESRTIASAPGEVQLYPNYPNPFNPATEISFRIPIRERVRLSVLDLYGRTVAVLVDQEKPAGHYTVPFDGRNLPSGIYLYRLTMDHSSLTRKMCLVK